MVVASTASDGPDSGVGVPTGVAVRLTGVVPDASPVKVKVSGHRLGLRTPPSLEVIAGDPSLDHRGFRMACTITAECVADTTAVSGRQYRTSKGASPSIGLAGIAAIPHRPGTAVSGFTRDCGDGVAARAAATVILRCEHRLRAAALQRLPGEG